jgi:hypothetical protein
MKNPLDKLNLRPNEKRFVVVVGAIVFVVLNLWFVWPHFKDLKVEQTKLTAARKTLINHRAEKLLIPKYTADLEKLRVEGSDVLSSDQAIHFVRTVEGLARSNGVDLTFSGAAVPLKGTTAVTNYFEEYGMQIRGTSGEAELVDFLYSLSSGGSMIRVRDMLIQPGTVDARAGGATNLNESVFLVASYQRNTSKAKLTVSTKPERKPETARPEPRKPETTPRVEPRRPETVKPGATRPTTSNPEGPRRGNSPGPGSGSTNTLRRPPR